MFGGLGIVGQVVVRMEVHLQACRVPESAVVEGDRALCHVSMELERLSGQWVWWVW